MIKLKNVQQDSRLPVYEYWSSGRIPCRDNSDFENVTNRLLKKLMHYLNNHPKLKLVSYSFVHDNGQDYYDWIITAIFEIK